jgi:hypothetical protein
MFIKSNHGFDKNIIIDTSKLPYYLKTISTLYQLKWFQVSMDEFQAALEQALSFDPSKCYQAICPTRIAISTITLTCKLVVPNIIDIARIRSAMECSDMDTSLQDVLGADTSIKLKDKAKRSFMNCIEFVYHTPIVKISIKMSTNGSLHIAGAKSGKDASRATDIICQLYCIIFEIDRIQKPSVSDFKIHMINSNFSTNAAIRLDLLGEKIKSQNIPTVYNKDNHPGLITRYDKDTTKKVTIIAFTTGSVLITGANNIEDVLKAYRFIVGCIDANFHHIFIPDYVRRDKKNATGEPSKRGRKRKCESMMFYDQLVL